MLPLVLVPRLRTTHLLSRPHFPVPHSPPTCLLPVPPRSTHNHRTEHPAADLRDYFATYHEHTPFASKPYLRIQGSCLHSATPVCRPSALLLSSDVHFVVTFVVKAMPTSIVTCILAVSFVGSHSYRYWPFPLYLSSLRNILSHTCPT